MKKAIVTGASQGLGKEISLQLVKANYDLILIARSKNLLEELVSIINQAGGKSEYYVCDISNPGEITGVFSKISSKYNNIDLLVNNAGVWTDDELEKLQPDRKRVSLETNLFGQILVTEAALPLLKKSKFSRILNVISTSGIEGIPAGNNTDWKVYGASKWGFKGYTNALRESLRNNSVQVLQFFPGGFESNLYENAKRPNSHNQPWMMKTTDVAEIAVFAITRPEDVYMEQIVVSKFMQ